MTPRHFTLLSCVVGCAVMFFAACGDYAPASVQAAESRCPTPLVPHPVLADSCTKPSPEAGAPLMECRPAREEEPLLLVCVNQETRDRCYLWQGGRPAMSCVRP